MIIGRNDPCPCGSGKKYKNCCLPQAAVISLEAVRIDRVFEDLFAKLSNHMASPATGNEIGFGFARFFADVPDVDDDLHEELDQTALDWVAFAYRTMDDGTTLCGRYATQGRDLTDQERGLLHAWTASSPGFYRVQEVAGSEGQLIRVPDGASFRVRAPGVPLEPGTLISAWLLPVLSGYCFGYNVDQIPDEALDPLTHLLGVEMALLQRQRPGATWDDLYREYWPRLVDAVTLAVVHGPDVLQIIPPPGPPVRGDGQQPPEAGSKWGDVARLVREALELEGDLLGDEVEGALRLWRDGALALRPRIVRPEGWAAGVVYLYRRDMLDTPVTQAEVGEQLGVSPATVSSRSRDLASALGVIPMDPRYVDLLDPIFRFAWRAHCLAICEDSLFDE